MVLIRPEVAGPKSMVFDEENVKSPGRPLEIVAVGILWVLRWVTFRESRAFVDPERGIFEGDGDATGEMSARGLVEGVKLTCFFTEGERRRSLEGVPGRSGRSLLSERTFVGSGRCVPAATLTGSSENFGCERCRIDLMGLNLAILDMYLLLPSVWGVPRVLVEADRLREGIIDVLEGLTLAERAREARVGVVTALGKVVGCGLAGVVG